MPKVKGVFEQKFLSAVENGPQNGSFWSKKGCKAGFVRSA